MNLSSPLLALAVLTAGVLQSPAALAVEGSNAVGYCQGALPSFDTEIRKRPLAVRNEGIAHAFVSCSVAYNAAGGNTTVSVIMVNRNAVVTAVDCTFVDGLVAEVGAPGFPAYYPQSLALLPGEINGIAWEADDFDLTSFSPWANLSCALPPGVEIAYILAFE